MARRRPVLAGNWKMNQGPDDARAFLRAFLELYPEHDDRSVILFPPAISLAAVRDELRGRADIATGVQNVHWEKSGAFTGEISCGIACQAGARYALVGHSERRHLFRESIEETVRKTRAALDEGLVPVLCVGETIEERRAGRAAEVVAAQLAPVLEALSPEEAGRFLVAYEPVWAIGTGETAQPADAQEMHAHVRQQFSDRFGADAAATLPILYGGSVKPENVQELLDEPDVDGALVGGASLDPVSFARICAVRA